VWGFCVGYDGLCMGCGGLFRGGIVEVIGNVWRELRGSRERLGGKGECQRYRATAWGGRRGNSHSGIGLSTANGWEQQAKLAGFGCSMMELSCKMHLR
jgi:hypothetical protein